MENKDIDVNKILFRCSSLGFIMTEPKEKAARERGELSETTKTHLIDKFVSVKYCRETDIVSKYTTKGLMVEEDSLTLYSRFKKRMFTKNEETLSDDFICGTPDVIKENVIDIKSSWDIFTFFRTAHKDINKQYYWQMQGYMCLTGAESAILAYCLTDTPEQLINDEKRKLLWKMGVISEEDANYQEAAAKLEATLTYSDIPLNERIIEIHINRNEDDIHRIYKRVMQCREYMFNEFINK